MPVQLSSKLVGVTALMVAAYSGFEGDTASRSERNKLTCLRWLSVAEAISLLITFNKAILYPRSWMGLAALDYALKGRHENSIIGTIPRGSAA